MSTFRTACVGLFAVSCALAACTGPVTSEVNQQVVTTDLSAYSTGQTVVVTYTNMGGSTTDWIALALSTDSNTQYEAWQYTGGGSAGTLTFANPGLVPGTYQARAYYDWNGTQSYTIQQTSPNFTVSAAMSGSATLTPNMTVYDPGAPVTINYSGFSGSTTDWIAINAPGTADTAYVAWSYTGGGTSGSLTFNGLADGTWEARYHADWDGTQSYTTLATSPQFTIAQSGTPGISTDQMTYGLGSPETLSWTNMPGNAGDWVAISVAGSPATSYVEFVYTGGTTSGSHTFTGALAAGNYEARAYVNDTYTIVATSTFTVTSTATPTVSTDHSNYSTTQSVIVTYSGLPGTASDMVAISVAGSPDNQQVATQSTNMQASGSATFSPLAAGSYEARAYSAGAVIARSATFTVSASCSVSSSPTFSSLASGDLTISASQSSNTASLSVPLASSILFTTIREDEQSPDFGATFCELGSAGVYCQRNDVGTDTPGSTGQIHIHWTVVTFSNGVTVQRGRVNTNTADPTTVTLSPVTTSESFILLGGQANGGTGWGNNEFIQAQLTSSTTLSVQDNTQGTLMTWQVVDMTGASVQRGTVSFASTDTTKSVSINATPTGTIALASYTTDNSSGIAASALMLETYLSDPSTLQLTRQGSGSSLSVSWEVISLPYMTHSGIANFASGQTIQTVSVAGISPTSSTAISGSQAILGQSSGSTSYAGSMNDLVGEGAATLSVGSGSVTLQRDTATSSAAIPYNVIDFSQSCTGM